MLPDGLKVDAIIVGSGAAGSHYAAKLAAGGKRVAILEAGPARSNADLVSSTLWARRLKWHGAPVLETGKNPVGHVFNAGYGVGGSALHHYAVWPRLHEGDFSLRSRHDRGLDWPISYDDLRPFYDAVQEEAGVSGDAEREIWRPPGAPYPMVPVPLMPQGALIAEGFKRVGLHTAPLPLAVNTQVYRGRAPCIWDGWCDAGCPIGALANPLTVHLPEALAAGATLHPDTTVTRVLTDSRGERAIGVQTVDAQGARGQVFADLVVLAAFTVQNARLLLASAGARHPDGLANSSGALGRYITTHLAAQIFGLHEQRTQPWLGAFGGQLLNQDHYDDKATHAASGALGSYQWMIAQAVKPNDLLGIAPSRPELFGAPLAAFMERAAQHFITMTGVIEDLPLAENRITLSERRDVNGVPLAAVARTSSSQSTALWDAAVLEGRRVLEATGASEVWSGSPAPMHIMGGTIMGADTRRSVANSFGQTHDIANLVIGGPGLFPTTGGVNPTFTVHALTARSAAYLLRNWRTITG